MTTPTIGRGVPIDVDRLIESRLLIQANSGAGKSWALRRLLEQTHGRVQQLVIDPEDEFHTLRERFDYILAGRHGGDCPADPRGAELLARKLLELGTSAIIGIYELKKHERILFVRRFLDALVNAPKTLWHPCLVVVDEAHMFCPQTGSAESASAVIDLMTRGRKRGFCGVLATQRISKLHKDAAAESNNKLIGRAALDIDMKRAAEELGLSGKAEQRQLRTLKPGEMFAFGPALTDQVTLVKVGAVKTTHPRAGQRAAPPPPPRTAVKKVLAELADLPERAIEEARTIQEARGRIKQLERELRGAQRTAPAQAPSTEQLDAARNQGRREAERAAATALKARDQAVARAVRQLDVARRALGETISRALQAAVEALGQEMPEISVAATSAPIRSPRPVPPPRDPDAGGNGTLQPYRQRILNALRWLETIGVGKVDRKRAAFLAGHSPASGSWNNSLGALRTSGYITYPSRGMLALTEAGRGLAVAEGTPTTTEELQELVLARLPAYRRRIVEALIARYPEVVSRGELADAAGHSPSSGSFNNSLGHLRGIGLLDYPDRGHVVATDALFLEGPP